MSEPSNPEPDTPARNRKKTAFLWILAAIFVVGALASMMTRFTVLESQGGEQLKLALVDPSVEQLRGAQLLVEQRNREGGVNGLAISLLSYQRDEVDRALSDGVVAMIGELSADQAKVPTILPSIASAEHTAGSQLLFTPLFDQRWEIQFLANYVRNVVGEKMVTVVRDDRETTAAQAALFDETLRRFGTKLVQEYTFSAVGGDEELASIAAEVKEKKLPGSILILGSAEKSATVLYQLRKAKVKSQVVGPSVMATSAFRQAVSSLGDGLFTESALLNGLLVTTPMLFDTANEAAQGFVDQYRENYSVSPDWSAAYGYESARILLDALQEDGSGSLSQSLLKMNGANRPGTKGINGKHWFDNSGAMHPPVRIGKYNGAELVSAMIQLQPIHDAGVTNYLDELIAGRALYVNDRFMYKTNVVYTGMQLLGLSEMDQEANTAEMELLLWFRYRSGKFEPQNLIFSNAVEPIELKEPEKEIVEKKVTYRLYRVKGKFYLNYSAVKRAYGTTLVGVSFTHQGLSQNNLMYVSDVLGMNLGVTDGQGGLMKSLKDADILKALPGLRLSRAWISQDRTLRSTEGHPSFVGYGKPMPLYSEMDHGVIIEPDRINVHNYLPEEYLIYLAIFALVAAVTAILMDRKERGQFWRAQSFGLRLLSWPALLISVGNLSLDYAIQHLSVSTIDMLVLLYDALWWLVPARLAAIVLERFVWVPLEERTGNIVPRVVRRFASVTIYLLAIFGVIAFVFGQQLTSLLATSGLMAMIIGLAVQSNIANVFAGIVLNIEKPFKIGDFVGYGSMASTPPNIGQVEEMTWRTMRIRHVDGYEVSIPNGQVSDKQFINFSASKRVAWRINLYLNPSYPPFEMRKLLVKALDENEFNLKIEDEEDFDRRVGYKGCVNVMGDWVSQFGIKLWVPHMGVKKNAVAQFYRSMHRILGEHDVSLIPVHPLEDYPLKDKSANPATLSSS